MLAPPQNETRTSRIHETRTSRINETPTSRVYETSTSRINETPTSRVHETPTWRLYQAAVRIREMRREHRGSMRREHRVSTIFVGILKSTKPTISACIISYNQQDHIAQTLEGALMQQVDVPYEIVVSDDCSTDNTAQIIEAFAKKDARIRVLRHHKNVGMHRNWLQAINACQGEFVALCEGDDTWTDNQKLTKQLAVLQATNTAAGCFTNADVEEFKGNRVPSGYVTLHKPTWNANDLLALHYNPIPTCTFMFRKSLFDGFPQSYYHSPFADRILHTLLILQGNYYFINQSTAVYRQHDKGVWSGIKVSKQHQNMLKSLQVIEEIVPLNTQKQLVRKSLLKQLDLMLYHYRREHDYVAYLKTWLKLKALA